MTCRLNIAGREIELDAVKWFLFLFFGLMLVGIDFSIVGDTFRDGKVRWLLLGCVPLLVVALGRYSVFLALFAGYVMGSWIFRNYPIHGVIDLAAVIGCTAFAGTMAKKFSADTVADFIGWCAAGNAALCLFQSVGATFPTPYDPSFHNIPVGTLGNPTIVGPLLAIGTYWALCKRGYYLLLLPVFAVALYRCGSAMSLVATAAGVAYFLFRRWPWKTLAAAAISAASIGIYIHMSGSEFFNFNGRFFIWPYGWNFFLENIYFGKGPGSWSGFYDLRGIPFPQKWDKLHNDILQGLGEYGLTGMSPLLAGLILFARRHLEVPEKAAGYLVIILANAPGNFPLHIVTYGVIAAWAMVVTEEHAWNSRSLPSTYSSDLWGVSGPTESTFSRRCRILWSDLTCRWQSLLTAMKGMSAGFNG